MLSPALGGLIIGHEVARGLGVRALFAERQDGALTLRRGFALAPGERVLIVEDVVTTGRLDARDDGGGARRGRRGGRRRRQSSIAAATSTSACRSDALATVSFPTWPEDQLPDWLAAIPVTKPGSRK